MSETIRKGSCPFTVERVMMRHRWDQLTFLHWSFEPEVVQRLLPKRLVVDTYNGAAWVGLVPFLMEVRSKRGNALDWPFRFPETNVRTYGQRSASRSVSRIVKASSPSLITT